MAAFVLLAGVILFGPVYGHFFAEGSHKYLGWKMFSRKATNFCAVEYSVVEAGEAAPLDRFTVLDPHGRRPRHLTHVRDLKAAEHLGRSMCPKLGKGAEVRVAVRCATGTGWRTDATGEENLCR